MFKFIPVFSALVFFLCTCLHPQPAKAKGLSLIRDAEIENTIRLYAMPLFEAADLDPLAIQFHLVKDPDINAFVAAGQNLFIHTGLLLKSETPNALIGVLAHETGHILGGHLATRLNAMKNAQSQTMIGYVLGGIAMVGGRPDVGTAIMKGGQGVGLTSLLNYTRGQESAADQAAVRLLDATKQSAKGLADFMEILVGQDLLSAKFQSPYMRTHPVSTHRLEFVQKHMSESPFTDANDSPDFIERHKRMKAKLQAFLNPPARTLLRLRKAENSVENTYALAIAHYRKSRLDQALPLIDKLIKLEPQNPFFWELKGQMLFENGRVGEALIAYREAARYAPTSALILVDLARTEIESQDASLLPSAIKHLERALQIEPRSSFAWRQLAVAAGRSDRRGTASLALAEEAYILNRKSDAAFHIAQAEKHLARGSREWLRIQDIKAQMKIGGNEKNK